MAVFLQPDQHLQAAGHELILCVLCFACQANKRWKGLEMRLTDAANEAKDNVRYLATLDQPFKVSCVRVVLIAQVHLQHLHMLLAILHIVTVQ